MLLRTAKSCGPDAPTLASRLRMLCRPYRASDTTSVRKRRWQESPVTEESTKETVKTIACGNAGQFRCIRLLVCFLLHEAHTRLRVQRAPGIPHALFGRARDKCKPRTLRAARTKSYMQLYQRHCERSEAIHSFFLLQHGLLRGACHRARIRATRWLAMTVSRPSWQHPQPSSPAKAGDPVFRGVNGRIEKLQSTGHSAGARHRARRRRDPVAEYDGFLWSDAAHALNTRLLPGLCSETVGTSISRSPARLRVAHFMVPFPTPTPLD